MVKKSKIAHLIYRHFPAHDLYIEPSGKDNAFIYSDPPYYRTNNNYTDNGWTWQDTLDCMDITFDNGIKGAMSEFDNPLIIEEAKRRNLNIVNICERQTLKNRNTEILITNYELQQELF